MHPSRGELQAWFDGELAGADADRVRAHVEGCLACGHQSDAIREATDVTRDLLEALDDPVPDVDVEAVIATAERRHVAPRRRHLPWAAVVAGLVSAGVLAAAIVPGSPLRELIESVGASGPDAPTTDGWSQEAGVAMTPGRRLDIVFEARQPTGTIELLSTTEDVARIEVAGDAVAFDVSSGEIVVENADARASYRIVLPDRLTAASIAIAGRSVYERQDGAVVRDGFEDEGDATRLRFDAR